MSATLSAPRVSAEASGLARVFRTEVQRVDAQMEQALAGVTAPLRARLKRHPRLRHELIAGAVRTYGSTVPSTFRIGSVEIDKDRVAFRISETRLSPAWMNDFSWQDLDYKEPGVAVMRFSLMLADGKLHQRWQPFAIVSLHALARRMERSRDRSHGSLVNDLSVLVSADPDSDSVAAGDGWWVGHRIGMKGKDGSGMVRAVRTFHS